MKFTTVYLCKDSPQNLCQEACGVIPSHCVNNSHLLFASTVLMFLPHSRVFCPLLLGLRSMTKEFRAGRRAKGWCLEVGSRQLWVPCLADSSGENTFVLPTVILLYDKFILQSHSGITWKIPCKEVWDKLNVFWFWVWLFRCCWFFSPESRCMFFCFVLFVLWLFVCFF